MSPVGTVLARAEEALRELGALAGPGLGEEELTEAVVGWQRLRGLLETGEARSLRAFDDGGVWALDGARSAAAWLAWRRHTPIGENRRLVRHAHTVARYPAVEDAWGSGEIGPAHLTALSRLDTPRTHDAFVQGHETLVDAARTQHWRSFTRACAYWAQHADPDGAERSAEAGREARAVHLNQGLAQQWFGTVNLDPVSGSIVAETLQDLQRELFEADWAQAAERLGHKPTKADLGRTPAQRRADALVEIFVRARSAPADARRPRPLFSILVGYETFAGPVCETFNRTVLTPTQAAQWLTDADVERIVFASPSRVLDVSESSRFYRGALRHAIELRDRTCWHPTCDEQPTRPQVDHIEDYWRGGPTTQHNGRWGCAHHNHDRTPPRNLHPPGPTGTTARGQPPAPPQDPDPPEPDEPSDTGPSERDPPEPGPPSEPDTSSEPNGSPSPPGSDQW